MITLSKWPTGSRGQGYVGAFILCESAAAPKVYSQSPPVHGLLPAPPRATSTSSGTHGMGHTGWFAWKPSLQGKIILAQRGTLPLCVSQRRGSLYNPSRAHYPVDTFLFLICSQHRFRSGTVDLNSCSNWLHYLISGSGVGTFTPQTQASLLYFKAVQLMHLEVMP